MERIGIGIVGLGGFASGRLNSIRINSSAKLVAVLSRKGSEEKVRKILQGKQLQAEIETEAGRFFSRKDLQAVIISLPNTFHYKLARASLQAGKHTAVEYPMTQSLTEYDELVSLARKKGLVLYHALTVLQEPLYLTMKDNLERIGKLLYSHIRYFGGKSWYVEPELSGDPFVGLHIHFVYQFRSLFGRPRWMASTLNQVPGQYVLGTILSRHQAGFAGVIDFAMGLRGPSYCWTIVGEKGCLEFDQNKGNKIVLKVAEGVKELDMLPRGTDDTNNFLDQTTGKAPAYISLAEGREAVELSLAASQAAREQKRWQEG